MQTNERRRSVPSTMCLNRSSFPPPSTRLLYSSPALLPEKLYYASPQPSCNITPYLRLPARPALSSANTTSEHATRHVDDRASLYSIFSHLSKPLLLLPSFCKLSIHLRRTLPVQHHTTHHGKRRATFYATYEREAVPLLVRLVPAAAYYKSRNQWL